MYIKTKKLKIILKALRTGNTIYNACKQAEIDASTLWKWRKRWPKLNERIQDLYDSRIQLVEDALYKSALEGSNTAQIFFLKNRCTLRWRDVQHMKGEGFGNVAVNVFPNKTVIFKDIDDSDSERNRDLYVAESSTRSLPESAIQSP